MSSHSSRCRWRAVLLIGLLFSAYSFWTASIPGSNEPHYLCKAKFFWQPEWCERDLFLQSSNPHFVFYVALGWLTKWLPLGVVAVIGRLSGYFALAAGWEWLCRALKLTDRATVLASALLIGCAASVNLSGEWLIGGIESKVYAYAAVFAGLGAFCERRLITAGCLFGVAIAFHPLVGVWSAVAVAFAGVVVFVIARRSVESECCERSFDVRTLLVAVVYCGAIAATGLVPALSSISGADAKDSLNATFIQVFHRLSHHLHPAHFPVGNYVAYIALLTSGLLLSRKLIPSESLRILKWFVIAAVLIAAAGWGAGVSLKPTDFGSRFFNVRMSALKFYPFRLADAVVPVFMSIVLAQRLSELIEWSPRGVLARRSSLLMVLLVASAFALSREVRAARYIPAVWEHDWLDVCHWLRSHTPEDALFVTPNESWAFKWLAERAEFVAIKDCPQDARSLVEWNRRQLWLKKWADKGFEDSRYDGAEMRALARFTQADFILTRRDVLIDGELLFENQTYLVYRLPTPETKAAIRSELSP